MRSIYLFGFTLLATAFLFGQNSYLKIYTAEQGVTAVSGADLTAAGIDISGIDPNTLQLFSDGQRVLPEATDMPPPSLAEIAIFVHDGDDGSFDSDSIPFNPSTTIPFVLRGNSNFEVKL